MSHDIELLWHGDAVAQLTFGDPRRDNQLCWSAIDELAALLTQCRERGARVVVLASSLEGHWFEHAWLGDLIAGLEGREQTGSGAGWFQALRELSAEEMISIAAINGNCSGGGAELGWACDLRIADVRAQFSQPEIDMGITTGIGGSSRLARLCGRATATEMVLTGKPFTAARLYQLGAINTVVDAGNALVSALEMAQTLAAKSPRALLGLKRILAHNEEVPLQEALQFEQEVFQSVVASEDAMTGMQRVQRGDVLAD